MKTQNSLCARTVVGLLPLMLFAAAIQPAWAQSPEALSKDEQVLRDLVRQENDGKILKHTDDAILSSGAAPMPVIGAEAREKLFEELNSKRLNQTRKVESQRLVVSNSGDMAYEFGKFTMSFDTPDKNHVALSGSYLRVWRKVGGEWMVDAVSARPHGPAHEKPANQNR